MAFGFNQEHEPKPATPVKQTVPPTVLKHGSVSEVDQFRDIYRHVKDNGKKLEQGRHLCSIEYVPVVAIPEVGGNYLHAKLGGIELMVQYSGSTKIKYEAGNAIFLDSLYDLLLRDKEKHYKETVSPTPSIPQNKTISRKITGYEETPTTFDMGLNGSIKMRLETPHNGPVDFLFANPAQLLSMVVDKHQEAAWAFLSNMKDAQDDDE